MEKNKSIKLSEKQFRVIKLLQDGGFISYFRGIGTRFTKSACIVDSNGINIETVSVSTVKALRDKNILEEFDRESYHSSFRLKKND